MPTYIPLPGSRRVPLSKSRPAGPVNLKEISSLTIRVRSKGNMDALRKRVYEQAALPPAERQYLTHEQLAAQYGSDSQDLDALEQVAQQHDLRVAYRSEGERCVVLQGELGHLLDAFPADLQMFHHASGTYRGRHGEIHIPEHLNGVISGIFGYDTRPKHRSPHNRKLLGAAGPGGKNGVAATEFAKRYNFPTQLQGTQLDGTGQTIAIVELGGGFRTTDLRAFFREINAPTPSVVSVSVDRAKNAPSNPNSDDGEVMLDIEVAGAVAPNAKFAVYFAPNNGDQGFIDAISAAVHDSQRKPSVISISWGGPESTTDQQGIQNFHDLFTAAAALGVTICVASGDHGTADLDASSWDNLIHVDHPSVDDLVLSCGGTQVDNGKDVVWNDGTPFDQSVPGGGGWASGGGISVVFPVPSYQTNAKLPVSIDTGKAGRGVPDIAMSATNYFTRVDGSEGASGGTSAVAPLMAALVALLNQATKKNVGFLNPLLYANAGNGATHDVTQGTNAITNTIKGYSAGPGWDACTGLGTPDGTAILNVLQGQASKTASKH
jgi:kumamolisin